MERNIGFYKNKAKKIIKYANSIVKHYKNKSSEEDQEEKQIIENLKKARDEWEMKEQYFQWVTDPDLVEHAAYELKASKIKYIYFLKKAKELGNK